MNLDTLSVEQLALLYLKVSPDDEDIRVQASVQAVIQQLRENREYREAVVTELKKEYENDKNLWS